MLRATRHLLSVFALAVMLGLLALAGAGRAEAADHAHHGPDVAQHQQHQQHQHHDAAAAAEPRDGAAPEQPSGPHHGGQCHCVSAACAPVLEPRLASLAVLVHRPLRHDHPAGSEASPLASVDPPPRPPRA